MLALKDHQVTRVHSLGTMNISTKVMAAQFVKHPYAIYRTNVDVAQYLSVRTLKEYRLID